MGCGGGQGAVRNGFTHCSLQINVSQGASGKRWVSESLWWVDSRVRPVKKHGP